MIGKWSKIDGFQSDSREPRCSVTGQPDNGKPVYRSVLIEMEGFFDICEASAEQLASEIGWKSPKDWKLQMDAAKARVETAEARVEELEDENAAMRAALDAMPPLGQFTIPPPPPSEELAPVVRMKRGTGKD